MHPGVALFFLVSLMTLRVCSGQAMSLEVCQSMIPEQETTQPQTKLAPYRLNVSESCFETGRSLQVTLAGENGSVFEGFFVQARKPNDDKFSFGKFNSGGESKLETIDCFNQSDNAIGHLNESGYNFMRTTFEWTAPADVNLDVIEFVATVVLKYNTFWVGLKAQLVRCNDNRDNNTSLSANNDTTSESTMTTVNNATTATTTTAIGNSTTSATNGTVHTSLSTATPTSMSESNTVAITTASSMSENNTVAITTASSTGENNTVAITTASSMSENTVAITTASMMNETTSGADRRKYSILSTAVVSSVAFVACLASVRLTY